MSEFQIKLKEYLALQKARHDILQKDFADKVGVDVMIISNYVTGRTKRPNKFIAQKIVDVTQGEITMKDMGYDEK